MKILASLSVLAFLLASCGVPAKEGTMTNSMSVSGEVPTTAKAMSGYEYPAMPLSEYQALQSSAATT